MRGVKFLLILAAVTLGFFMCYTSAQAQSKGVDAKQKIEKSKVGQDMKDVKQNAPGTFDGSGTRPAPPVKVQTSTTTPTVTPTQRNIAVPKKYQSLHTTPPPSPVVTPKQAPKATPQQAPKVTPQASPTPAKSSPPPSSVVTPKTSTSTATSPSSSSSSSSSSVSKSSSTTTTPKK